MVEQAAVDEDAPSTSTEWQAAAIRNQQQQPLSNVTVSGSNHFFEFGTQPMTLLDQAIQALMDSIPPEMLLGEGIDLPTYEFGTRRMTPLDEAFQALVDSIPPEMLLGEGVDLPIYDFGTPQPVAAQGAATATGVVPAPAATYPVTQAGLEASDDKDAVLDDTEPAMEQLQEFVSRFPPA